MFIILRSIVAFSATICIVSQPLTSTEKEAVGVALSNALGVLSGKVKSGDKFTICSNMFPDGAPVDTNDASWQACKDELPNQHVYGSLLAWKQAVIAKGGAKEPLTVAERDAVGAALTNALGVLSGKVKSGDKESICADMFPKGAPANAGSDPSWQACKGVVIGSLLSKKRTLTKVMSPLTAAEKEAVGAALSNALGVMSGKIKSTDKFSICSDMFPSGAPPNAATDASWQACKDSLPSAQSFSSLISWKRAVIAKGGAKHPLTTSEQEAVGAALSNALGVLSGKIQSGSKFDICSDLFPNGAPADAASNASWQACKGVVSGQGAVLLARVAQHTK
jgi:hypothetical protein